MRITQRVILTATLVAALFIVAGAAAASSAGTVGSVSSAAVSTSSDLVVLASGRNFPDALAGAVLACECDAPLLLTEPDRLPAGVAAHITALGATRAIVLGGESAVGPAVITALNGLGITDVERVWGSDRFATSVAISERAVAAMGENASRLATLEERVGSLESSASAEAEFWPDVAFTVSEPSWIGRSLSPTQWSLYIERPRLYGTYGQSTWELSAEEALFLVRIDGQEYMGRITTFIGPAEEAPTEGAPVEIEYWFEYHGEYIHGTKTIPGGWTW